MEESRRDGIETIEGIRAIKAELPGVSTILGLSNVSFGLNPAARQVLNSVFLHECVEAGLDSAIVHASKILPLSRIDERAKEVCLDLVYDRRTRRLRPAAGAAGALRGGQGRRAGRRTSTSTGRSTAGCRQRIIDGNRNGLEGDLTEALESGLAALDIVNDMLLAGMKVVGDRFASGEMQLPFVLQSAETMKAAVAFLEPHMEKADQGGKGTVVLATVKGDVHDIGKNLVDIILTNNGYEVVNLGIKVGINEMVAAAEEHEADAIGMSGLLVKSTLIMRENLVELNDRSLSNIPVLLGGAALTRTYVERDLREVYDGRLFYGRDAFEGLRTMDRLVELKRTGEDDPDFGREISERNVPQAQPARRRTPTPVEGQPARSDVAADNALFVPPFVGTRVAVGHPDRRHRRVPQPDGALPQPVGLPARGRRERHRVQGPGEGDAARAAGQGQGGRPAGAAGGLRPLRRQRRGQRPRHLEGRVPARRSGCASPSPASARSPGSASPTSSARPGRGDEDFASFMLCTIGARASEEAARLFAENHYQDYLFLHGLSVEMAEATAEYWHRRIREELGFADEDGPTLTGLFRQQYRGGRYSWGYPACPDLDDNAKVVELLGGDRIGVTVSEGFQLQPRADDRRHHLPPPRGQVLRRVRACRARPAARCSVGAALLWPCACLLVACRHRPPPPRPATRAAALGTGGDPQPRARATPSTSAGPARPSEFASDVAGPGGGGGRAVHPGASPSRTYERVWQADGGPTRCRTSSSASRTPWGPRRSCRAAQHSLESGEIVSVGPAGVHPRAPAA